MNSKASSTSICLSFCITKFAFALLLMWLLTDKEANAQNFWQQTNGPSPYALAINSSGHIFAGGENGVYRSTNNGDSWTVVKSGLPNSGVLALAINSSRHIFAGMVNGDGIFRSRNNGDSWAAVNSGLGLTNDTDVNALAINSSGHILAGTYGGGVFRGVESTTAVKERATELLPLSFELAQNHPNPFNPSTTIKYDLAKTVEVKLVIFGIMGQHVRTLVNQKQQAGRHAITWDGRNEQGQAIASGVYIYQLRAENFVQTRRMVLVR